MERTPVPELCGPLAGDLGEGAGGMSWRDREFLGQTEQGARGGLRAAMENGEL